MIRITLTLVLLFASSNVQAGRRKTYQHQLNVAGRIQNRHDRIVTGVTAARARTVENITQIGANLSGLGLPVSILRAIIHRGF